jgi:hypothetical protein
MGKGDTEIVGEKKKKKREREAQADGERERLMCESLALW